MMPSKKKKYNARFPAGRIKKIMQSDDEVGKVAQAVPIIISRTLELFVESLLTRATRVTRQRNAKTLSPSHLKQCIQEEARFDFLRDLVKNIPDVSAAEERENHSGENSPNSVGCSDPSQSTRRAETAEAPKTRSQQITENPAVKLPLSDHPPSKLPRMGHPPNKLPHPDQPSSKLTRSNSTPGKSCRLECPPAKVPRTDSHPGRMPHLENPPGKFSRSDSLPKAMDLTKRADTRRPNFYQETLPPDVDPPNSVIRYANPQPSTSTKKALPKMYPLCIDLTTSVVQSPVNPVLNIDFTKNLQKPEFKVLDKTLVPKMAADEVNIPQNFTVKALSRSSVGEEIRKVDLLGAGNLEIDEDYDT